MIDQAVERDASGAPVAFRIWGSGWTRTDKGDHLLDEQAAQQLLVEQTQRGNRYSVDYDHLSLSDTAPPEARIAAGSFRLEVRRDRNGQPELWATDCKWTAKARAAILAGEWQSMSPAYTVDHRTRRVVSLTNIALTSIPATHRAPRLSLAASRSGGRVQIAANRLGNGNGMNQATIRAAVDELEQDDDLSFDEIVDALKAIAADESQPQEKRDAATKMLAVLEEKEALRTRMGLPSRRAAVRREGCHQIFSTLGVGR